MSDKNFFNYFNYLVTGTSHGGPFNKVAKKRPRGRDGVFWKHDVAYGKYGSAAYYKWNDADNALLNKLSYSDPRNYLAMGYFALKKRIAPQLTIKSNSRNLSAEMPKRSRGGAYRPSSTAASSSGRGRVYGPSLGNVTSGEVHRFKAGLVSDKRLNKSFRFKRPRAHQNPKQLAALENPIVNWVFNGPTAGPNYTTNPIKEVSSQGGRQGVVPYGVWDGYIVNHPALRLANADDLQKIYRKMYEDVGHKMVTNAGPMPYNESGASAQAYMPSLRCLKYERTHAFFNVRNTIAYLEVWDIIHKVDDPGLNPAFMWKEALVKAGGNTSSDPTNVGNYGLNQARLNSVPPTQEDVWEVYDPGRRPGPDLKEWHKQFKVLRKRKIRMEPLSHYKMVTTIPGFTVSQHALFDQDSIADCISNVTLDLMVFVIGEKCYDNQAGNQHASYVPCNVTYTYRDDTSWTMHKRGFTTLNWETNGPAQFEDLLNDPHYVAITPAIGIPAGSAVHEEIASATIPA